MVWGQAVRRSGGLEIIRPGNHDVSRTRGKGTRGPENRRSGGQEISRSGDHDISRTRGQGIRGQEDRRSGVRRSVDQEIMMSARQEVSGQ